MEKSSSLSCSQVPVGVGFISCMYFFRKARNVSCSWTCFTTQTDIDQFMEMEVGKLALHQSYCIFTANISDGY